ncbi:MAG: DUF4332 domain-containing protein [Pseudodesulfovibrio sp.]|nr:DUF4332 domain-containing protein [Pseudodesulfovibrio sp.]
MNSFDEATAKAALKRLQAIPGVGPSLAKNLLDMGYSSVPELSGENPEAMYRKTIELAEKHVDRCVLYVFRCAVYFASNSQHEPEKLKWWTWKD